jgi:hypothetical protein
LDCILVAVVSILSLSGRLRARGIEDGRHAGLCGHRVGGHAPLLSSLRGVAEALHVSIDIVKESARAIESVPVLVLLPLLQVLPRHCSPPCALVGYSSL